MPKITMTKRDFFEYYKNIVSQIDDGCAAEWLLNAGNLKEEDFVNDDEDIVVDPEEFVLMGQPFASGAGTYINKAIAGRFGLSDEKANELASLFKSGKAVDDFAKKVIEKFSDIVEAGKSMTLERNDKTRKLFGWADDLYEAVDIIADYGKKDAAVKSESLTFHMQDNDGKDVEISVGEADKAINEGKLVFAKGRSFGDIPLLKNGNEILNPVVIDNVRPERAIRKVETKIPKVTGLWNRFCRLLGIETEGTKDYFAAKRREKARDAEYKAKIDAFKTAKKKLMGSDYRYALVKRADDFGVIGENKKDIRGRKPGEVIEAERDKRYEDIREKARQESNDKSDKKFFDFDEKGKAKSIKAEFENKIVTAAAERFGAEHAIEKLEDLDLYVAEGLKYKKVGSIAELAEKMRGGKMVFALPKSENAETLPTKTVESKGVNFFEDLTGDMDIVVGKKRQKRVSEFETKAKRSRLVDAIDVVMTKMDSVSEMCQGSRGLRKGENTAKWISDAYVNLRTKPIPSDEELNKWLDEHKNEIIETYKANTKDGTEKQEKIIDDLNEIDVKSFRDVIEIERNYYVKTYFSPSREKYVSSLNAGPEENVKLSDFEKGEKIINETRKQAYLTIMNQKSDHEKVSRSIAAVIACRKLIDGHNVEQIEGIGKSPMTIENYVKDVCRRPVLMYMSGEYKGMMESVTNSEDDLTVSEMRQKLAETALKKEQEEYREYGFREFVDPCGREPFSSETYERVRCSIYDKLDKDIVTRAEAKNMKLNVVGEIENNVKNEGLGLK